ncbi:MAG: class I SAM-dependent methyltransferase [Puniceicoccaceae bacterium]
MASGKEKVNPESGSEPGSALSNERYFSEERTVEDYARAVAEVGLWVSEERIFTRLFKKEDTLLELGCGAGRISIGLWELGYRDLFATDVSRPMVDRARALAQLLEYEIKVGVQDATALNFGPGTFDGVIFGFNGLMMVGGLKKRMAVLREVFRVLRAGGYFVFTGHDREQSPYGDFWEEEAARWERGGQDPRTEVFGDRIADTCEGPCYIHVPTKDEVLGWLSETAWQVEATFLRSEMLQEPPGVEAFSDDTRFWVLRKPSL